MKKILCLTLGMSACVALAEDSYIYWMLSPNASYSSEAAGPLEPGTYQARVVGIQEGKDYDFNWNNTYLNMSTELGVAGDDWVTVSVGGLNPGFIAYGAQSSGWKYYVELYNDGKIFARSVESAPAVYSHDSIAAIGSISAPSNMWLLLNMAPQSAPEPSSGLLMLLGCAALALRRRRQKAVRA